MLALGLPTTSRTKAHAGRAVAQVHEAVASGKLAWTGRRWKLVGTACVLCDDETEITRIQDWDVLCWKHLRDALELKEKR